MAASKKQFDLLIYGASGFTGRLVARYLTQNAPNELTWGIAGRNREKLQLIADECKALNPKQDVSIVVGYGEVAAVTRAIITTAGPYLLYGEVLLKACIEHGTDYADLTGETLWVHKMILKYGAEAKAKGVIIVPMSGFDSVPADLTSFFLASETRRTLGVRVSEMTAYVTARGSVSGGTIASGMNMAKQPDRGLTSDPLILNPLKSDTPLPAGSPSAESVVAPLSDFAWPFWVNELGQWASFFVMSSINTRIVRRSATIFATQGTKLAGHPAALASLKGSGAGDMSISKSPFKYTEWSLSSSWWTSVTTTLALGIAGALMSMPGGSSLLSHLLPKPGEGPSDHRITTNWFQYIIVGRTEEDVPRTVVARMHGRDGGYGDTALMLSEAGIALALQRKDLPGTALHGGFLTPSTAFGHILVRRLNAANLRLEMMPSIESAAAAARRKEAPPALGVPSNFDL